jgi:rubrerythrin
MSDQTNKNLKMAFAGESQANRRYLAYAKKAEEEGFPNAARLFRVIAEAETIHANTHLEALEGVKSTLENVENAMRGESEEATGMYPMFVYQAERDANNKALNSFFYAQEAESTHCDLFEKALTSLKDGKDPELKELYICVVCGYTVEGPPPEKCYTCNEGRDKFVLFQ